MASNLEVFEIFDSGEYEMATDGNCLREILKEDNVYIILSHDMKICWIWIGKTCNNVRKKFASARVSRTILSDRQLAYNVKTVDSDQEPDIFKDLIDKPIQKAGRTEGPSLEHLRLQKMILEKELPPDCNREAILINNNFYVAVEVKVLGNVISKFEQSAFLPEGISDLPENYLTRIFVKHGRVEAVEFFKKNQSTKKLVVKEKDTSTKPIKKEIEYKSKVSTKNDPVKIPKRFEQDSTVGSEDQTKNPLKSTIKTKKRKKIINP